MRGLGDVSIREITRAAECNPAAVHYHFGTKLELVRELLRSRMSGLADQREWALERLRSESPVTARTIATVWIRPLASTITVTQDGHFNSRYLAFVASLQTAPDEHRMVAREEFSPFRETLVGYMPEVAPGLPPPVREFRLDLAMKASIRALVDIEDMRAPWLSRGQEAGIEDIVWQLVATFEAILTGEAPSPR